MVLGLSNQVLGPSGGGGGGGNAESANTLTTARNIGGVSFDGSAPINLPGVNTAGNQNTSGNSGTTTKLATAVNIGGVSFDGSAPINLPGVNTAGDQNTSGNSGTATTLATARNIGGVSFDGSADVDLPGINAPKSVVLIGSNTDLSPPTHSHTIKLLADGGSGIEITLGSSNAKVGDVYVFKVTGNGEYTFSASSGSTLLIYGFAKMFIENGKFIDGHHTYNSTSIELNETDSGGRVGSMIVIRVLSVTGVNILIHANMDLSVSEVEETTNPFVGGGG